MGLLSFLKRQRNLRRILARPAAQDSSIVVPFEQVKYDGSPAFAAPSVAVMLHIYHVDMVGQLATFCKNIAGPCDLLITTDTNEKISIIEDAFCNWDLGNVFTQLVVNRGRDIAPKLGIISRRYKDYDYILFLHSKKSDFADFTLGWSDKAFYGLCGSPEIVKSIFKIFEADPKMGIIFPQHHENIRWAINWGKNYRQAQALAKRLGLSVIRRGTMDFPSGSMFWARPAALDGLLALGLTHEDFPEELGQLDGTIAHAIERLFLISAERLGFTWIKVAVPNLYRDQHAMVEVRNLKSLADILTQARFDLLGRMALTTHNATRNR